MKRLTRLKYKIVHIINSAHAGNDRAAVEQELWNCYHGKSPLPDKKQCREWAIKLGIPRRYR